MDLLLMTPESAPHIVYLTKEMMVSCILRIEGTLLYPIIPYSNKYHFIYGYIYFD